MDQKNPFETPATFGLHRTEYLVGLLVAVGFFFAHITRVSWLPAIVLFAYIDLIGYIPGAIAYHRSKDKRISKGYYIAYNTMHSLVTQGLVAAVYMLVVHPEWTLLVLPIHLFGDRALFGNFLKSFDLPFEPESTPAYGRLIAKLRADRRARARARAAAPVGHGLIARPEADALTGGPAATAGSGR